MLTLVGAGWHWFRDLAGADLAAPDVAIRPLAGRRDATTFLLRRRGEPSEPIKRFMSREGDWRGTRR